MTLSKKHWQECGQGIGEEGKEVEGTCQRTLARACTCSEGLNLEILRKQSIKLNDQLNLREQRSVKNAGFCFFVFFFPSGIVFFLLLAPPSSTSNCLVNCYLSYACPRTHRITSITSLQYSTSRKVFISSMSVLLFCKFCKDKGLVISLVLTPGSVLGTWKMLIECLVHEFEYCGISEQRCLVEVDDRFENQEKGWKLGSILHLVVTEVGVERWPWQHTEREERALENRSISYLQSKDVS